VLPLVGGRWDWSFAVWGAPVLATALLILLGTRESAAMPGAARARWWPNWRDGRAWQLGLVQGGGSALYFGCNAFIPDYLHAVGRPELVNACLTALNAGQLPASVVILMLARRIVGRKTPFIAAALVGLACLGGVLVPVPAVMVASAGVIGFAAAFILILTLALPPLLAPPEDVHRLSAAVLTISYTVTFIVPLIGGWIWDATEVPAVAVLPGVVGALGVLALATMLPPVRR